MLSHHQPQAPTKTFPQTDLEMSRTAERSQGFHDLWPHTPKLNTRNTVKEWKEPEMPNKRHADKRSPGYQQSSAECRRIHSKAVLGGPREEAGGLTPTTPAAEASRQVLREDRAAPGREKPGVALPCTRAEPAAPSAGTGGMA